MTRMLTGLGVLPVLCIVLHPAQVEGVDPRRSSVPGSTASATPDPFSPPTLSVSPTPAVPPVTVPPVGRERITDTAASTFTAPTPGGISPHLISYPETPRPARWKLGVYSQDTQTGVQIIRVQPASAAERAGLEPNDLIIAVGGYQVGFVNGQQYDCGAEFERRADSLGRVMLLVQDGRSKSVVNLPVTLESRLERINGQITLRSRASLPADAIVMIELREMIRQDTPPVTIAQHRIDTIRQQPIPFELEFDPMDIDPRRTYLVRAAIVSQGRTLYSSSDTYPVLTNGRPKTVAVAVDPLGAGHPQQLADTRQAEIEQQIIKWYRDYLGRDPYPNEMPVWKNMVTDRGRSMFDVQADILATDGVWTMCDRDKAQYVTLLHQKLLGRAPTQEELDYWTYRFDQSGLRRNISSEFLTQVGVPR